MPLNILFMGTPEFSVSILKSINESAHNLLAVYTQPAKKKLRGQKTIDTPVYNYAKNFNIPIRCPDTINTKQELEFIKNLKADIAIVVAYGKILPEELLSNSKIPFINIHASLLPKWRGAAPIQRAIMNMDEETGISFMKIVKELDAGPVMKSIKINIEKDTTYEDLNQRMSFLSASAVIECLNTIEKKQEKFIPQDDTKATYAKKINKLEGKISWNDKAKNIIAKINALYPNPGSWFELNRLRIKVLKAKEVKIKGSPGEIINNNFVIGCGENSIQILQLKKEGKNKMTAIDFLNGNSLETGKNLNEI